MSNSTFTAAFVTSSAIEFIAFNSNNGVLRVMFTSGVMYDYTGCTMSDFENLATAESVGREFQWIRNTCNYLRVEAAQAARFLTALARAKTSGFISVEA